MNANANSARSRAIRRNAPRAFIENTTTVLVRFNEVDALRIVWHGHYVNYFEEGRRAFGRRLGIDYTTFIEQGIAVPVIHLEVNYLAPAGCRHARSHRPPAQIRERAAGFRLRNPPRRATPRCWPPAAPARSSPRRRANCS
jgi:hypothetical protein